LKQSAERAYDTHDPEHEVHLSKQGRAKLKALIREVKNTIRIRESAALNDTPMPPSKSFASGERRYHITCYETIHQAMRGNDRNLTISSNKDSVNFIVRYVAAYVVKHKTKH
jgi:hypothetical protein